MAHDILGELQMKKSELTRKIHEINFEIRQIDSLIYKYSIENSLNEGEFIINKKNEKSVFIYGLIKLFLKEQSNYKKDSGLTTGEIFKRFQRDRIEIKYTTLRSCLHRLEKQGRLVRRSHGGSWRLGQPYGENDVNTSIQTK